MELINKAIDKAKTILEAVKNKIIDDEEFRPLANSRLTTCVPCEYNNLGICQQCSCIVSVKAFSRRINNHGELENCPENLWLPIHRVDENGDKFVLIDEIPSEFKHHFLEFEERIPMQVWINFVGGKNEET